MLLITLVNVACATNSVKRDAENEFESLRAPAESMHRFTIDFPDHAAIARLAVGIGVFCVSGAFPG